MRAVFFIVGVILTAIVVGGVSSMLTDGDGNADALWIVPLFVLAAAGCFIASGRVAPRETR